MCIPIFAESGSNLHGLKFQWNIESSVFDFYAVFICSDYWDQQFKQYKLSNLDQS